MSLADNFKQAREFLKKNQKEMAILVDVGYRSWQGYEDGSNSPGSKVIESLVKLGFNANWLLTGEGMMRLDGAGGQSEAVKIKLIQAQGEEIKRLEAALEAAKASALDPAQAMQLLADMNRRLSVLERENDELKQYAGNLKKQLEDKEEMIAQLNSERGLQQKVA